MGVTDGQSAGCFKTSIPYRFKPSLASFICRGLCEIEYSLIDHIFVCRPRDTGAVDFSLRGIVRG